MYLMWLFSVFHQYQIFLNIEVRAESIAVVYKLACFSSYRRNGEVA